MKTLSDLSIRRLDPNNPRKVYDAGKGAVSGLHVLVTPAGAKLFRLRYWIDGVDTAGKRKAIERQLALGAYPEVSLAEARRRALEARGVVASGGDPVASRRAQRAADARERANTFGAYAKRWLDDGAWILATRKQYARLLERDILPALGKRPVGDITRADVDAIVRGAARQRVGKDAEGKRKRIGGVISARHVRQIISAVLDVALDDDAVVANVAAIRRTRTKSKRKVTHHVVTPYRHLSADGLAALLRKLDEYRGQPETVAAMRLLILCFTRPTELREARWSEFDLDAVGGAIWNIPPERMKGRRPHDVPLSHQAVAILRELHPLSSASGWLFPHTREPKKPMGRSTLQRALEYLEINGSPHGFRHSASTLLHDAGFDSLVIEKQLAHADRNATRRSYNMASFLPERRRMLQHWADYLDCLRDGNAKVVPMKRRA
jgi:integrase